MVLFRKILALFIMISFLVTSCDVPEQSPVDWQPLEENTDNKSSEYGEVSVDYRDPESFAGDFCDGNPNHECIGGYELGWRGIYDGHELIGIEYFTPQKQFFIEVVDGEYFLHCGYGVRSSIKRTQVSEGFIDNVENAILELQDAQDKYEDATSSAANGAGWVVGGAVIACGAAIGFTFFTGGGGSPTLLVCAKAAGWGTIGGIAAALGTGAHQTSTARDDLESANANLKGLLESVCP